MRIIYLIFLLFPLHSFSTETVSTPELKAGLISECDVAPQQGKFSAGILFELQPGWHLYWINPGDAGLAPKINWRLSSGITAGEISWPYPHAIHIDAISNFGYSDKLLLPVTFTTNTTDKTANITADISWLVCSDVCIPGKATLSKNLHTEKTCKANNYINEFTLWQDKIPMPLELLQVTATIVDKKFQLELYAQHPVFRDAKSVDIFIENTRVVSYQPTQTQRWKHNWLIWTQELNDTFKDLPDVMNAVIVVDHHTSYKIHLSTEEKTP